MANNEQTSSTLRLMEAAIIATCNKAGERLHDDLAALPKEHQRTILDLIRKDESRKR